MTTGATTTSALQLSDLVHDLVPLAHRHREQDAASSTKLRMGRGPIATPVPATHATLAFGRHRA